MKTKIKRERLRERFRDWKPEWQGTVFERYAINQARANVWRVAPLYDFADLYQELAIKFLYVVERYPEVEEPAHFMSLFKQACRNHIHDLASKRGRTIRPVSGVDPEGNAIVDLIPSREDSIGWAELRIAIERAPASIRRICANALAGKGGYRRLQGGGRETRSQLLCRLAEADGSFLLDSFRDWALKEFGKA